jgi:hypothetical protein
MPQLSAMSKKAARAALPSKHPSAAKELSICRQANWCCASVDANQVVFFA